MITSTLDTKFIKRVCPSVNEEQCNKNSSYSEPVVGTVSIRELVYNTAPRNTLDCSTGTLK